MQRTLQNFCRLPGIALLCAVSLYAQAYPPPVGVPLPDPPQVRSPFVLDAINDPVTGKGAFSFEGHEIPPVIRAAPGNKIQLDYVNRMSSHSREVCVDGPCTNMTNLHFHGLHVSPEAPQDDVLTMMAMPGESLHYTVEIPANQPPGLYWYHTHPHGESYQQSLDGMSGAIVIDGLESYLPELRNMKERVLILRDAELQHDASSALLKNAAQLSRYTCGPATDEPARIFTVNGVVRPKIAIAPGEKQFWRIVNASPDLYADLTIDSEAMTVVAFDGMPLAFHDRSRRTEKRGHVLLAPAGRIEIIVTGPRHGITASLRSLCVDTGPDGDPNPRMALADLDTSASPDTIKSHAQNAAYTRAMYSPLPRRHIADLERAAPAFVVKFTEDKNGFYINDRKYTPADDPMTTVRVGEYVHWRVVNATHEIHPFHIHQVHFLVYKQNEMEIAQKEWMDTVNLDPGESLDLVMDFTDPIIRGVSLFHCHLLKHEDKGMMAKILFQ